MKCFYHNDMDGRCAGSVVAEFENNYNSEDYFEVDYNKDLISIIKNFSKGEKIYFVDYSFKNTDIIDYILNNGMEMIWIDHHTSSINLINQNPRLESISGLRLDGISGAALTYMYLYGKEFEDIPYYIQLVSDYDCWKFKFDPDTTYFKIGIETKEYNALDAIWKLLSEQGYECVHAEISDLSSIIKSGGMIKSYIDRDNASYKNQYAYESIIDGHTAIVVNRKSNSWIFGEDFYKYPLVCVWAFNGERFSYSIFSNDKDVDCSKIAEKFGGGGHRGAAGFMSDELLFKSL